MRRIRRCLTLGRTATVLALAAALALVAVAPATASRVSGRQLIVNEAKGKYRMTGGLIGKWKVTKFKVLSEGPVFEGKGRERFRGCLNRDHNRSCDGDPKGTLKFKFHYWARFASDGSTELGTCAHPIVGGRGDFDHAKGFLMMVDKPTAQPPFVTTHYHGVIYPNRLGSWDKLADQEPVPGPC